MSINLLYPRLLGDVGGTNARFGWQSHEGAKLTHIQSLPCTDYPDIESAIRAYLALEAVDSPLAACIGIANPVTGDQITMTNHNWSFSIQDLKTKLSLQSLKVINDFTALALSLLNLPSGHRKQIGGASACNRSSIALIGPGTGLGVSGLIPHGENSWAAISGEGGHVTLSAHSEIEYRAIEHIRKLYGHVSAERVLCGKGLVDLHAALSFIHHGSSSKVMTPEDIVQNALSNHDTSCLQTLDMFAGFLGSVAGDLALTLGSRGGVYIGGGIVPRLMGWFETSSFRSRFESKGRFSSFLEKIPVWVIQSPESPALWGAANALDMN